MIHISQEICTRFVVLCFVVVMQSFIMNSREVFIHIHQGCFAGTGAIVRLPQCQWSNPDGYGEISQCITTTKHSKAKTVCIFLGIYCTNGMQDNKIHVQAEIYKLKVLWSYSHKSIILNRAQISVKIIQYTEGQSTNWYHFFETG